VAADIKPGDVFEWAVQNIHLCICTRTEAGKVWGIYINEPNYQAESCILGGSNLSRITLYPNATLQLGAPVTHL
jgi:hypothetical protein